MRMTGPLVSLVRISVFTAFTVLGCYPSVLAQPLMTSKEKPFSNIPPGNSRSRPRSY